MQDMLQKISYNRILTSLLILALSYALIKIGTALFKKLSEKYAQKRIQIKSLIPIFKLIVYVLALLFIGFGVFQVSGESLIAVGVSLGVAVGFAFQDILGNFFGGLIIIFGKPFAIGDKIQIGSHYGEVVDISLRRIQVVTPDDSIISIPNKAILTEHVSNANSGELNCQVVTEIFLPAHTDLKKMHQAALETAYSSPYIFLKKPVSIVFQHHFQRELKIKMKVKAYVFDHRYEFAFASDITKRVQEFLLEGARKEF
jgi:small-conductance mechanosensitive channel